MADIINNLPPANIEAEEAILGGILLDPEAIGRVAELIVTDAFYVQAHREIYHAALTLHNKGEPTDFMSVSTYLSDRNLINKVGGTTKLAQLLNRTVSAVNVDRYAKLIMEKYIRRQLITSGHEIVDLGYDSTKELEVVLDESEQKIFRLTQERPTDGLVPISETLVNTFNNIEELHQETALPGIPSGYYDIDAMTSGFSRSDLIIIAGRPSMGKCLAADAELVSQDGSLKTIEEIYQGSQDTLLTLQANWRFAWTQPSAFVDDGIKPVYQVTTRLGRTIKTTLTHPFLTINGWRSLGTLRSGNKIAVPRQIKAFGNNVISPAKVKLLAYLIGDGCLTKTCPEFTNSNPVLRQDFKDALASFGEFDFDNNSNGLTLWLKKLNLWGKDAHGKVIPQLIFTLKPNLIALFLNRLFATDGWATVLNSGQSQLGYATVSEKLARQIQHLLLRFGIIASLRNRSVKYQNQQRQIWQLDITDERSIKTFIDEIGIFGKEKAINAVGEAISKRRYQTNKDLIPVEIWQELKQAKSTESWQAVAKRAGIKGYSNIHVNKRALSRDRLFKLAYALDNIQLQNLATSEVYWDEIVSIQYVGRQQVYDLTIPETHNFVANDVCVHNTAFSLCVASNIARESRLPVAIFSLEMSREQLTQRLLSSESKIPSNRLRSGRISQNEFEPLVNAVGKLSELPIFIDDTANLTVMQMRSQVRRLQAQQPEPLGLILLDYLQLMEGGDNDNRVQQLSKMTRSLKGLARELNVPIIALSQLSRGVEQRNNKRPMLSDLRESGCLSGDSSIAMADTGMRIPIKNLVGKVGFKVWALNQTTKKIEPALVSRAFTTGVKPVFSLKTALGRKILATANHKFLTIHGWQRLDELVAGDYLATPRILPSSYLSQQTTLSMQKQEITNRQMQSLLGNKYCGTSLYKQNLSRQRASKLATVVKSQELKNLANSDLYWDKIVSIEAEGETQVYDLTVPSHHNFVANDIVVHNSIEQDADLVMMLYRDEYYNPDSPDRGVAEVSIVKHRNGPVGTVKLIFNAEQTKFESMARPSGY